MEERMNGSSFVPSSASVWARHFSQGRRCERVLLCEATPAPLPPPGRLPRRGPSAAYTSRQKAAGTRRLAAGVPGGVLGSAGGVGVGGRLGVHGGRGGGCERLPLRGEATKATLR